MPGLSCRIFSCGIQILSCCIWDLVPWSGIKPGPPALGAWNLSHWTAKEAPKAEFNPEETSDEWETSSYHCWPCWAFASCTDGGCSPAAARGLPPCGGFSMLLSASLWSIRLLAYGLQELQHAGSGAAVYGPSCSVARGIFLDQGSDLCPLPWQMGSYPLYHQGSPVCLLKKMSNL